MKIDGRVMVVWLLCCVVMILTLDGPIPSVIAIAGAAAVAAALPDSPRFRSILILGTLLIVTRAILFSLTGHDGSTVVANMPLMRLPSILGGLVLGGPVTAEVLMSSVSESLRFVAVIACFFAFIASTSSVDLLRSLPGYLFQAGLALNLALVFAPSLVKTAVGIRDFQRVRHRRARSPIWIVPLLATALERSIAVAESMDSRGFGRRTVAPPAWARRMAAGGGLLVATGGGAFAAGSRSLMAWGAMIAGAALLAGGLIGLGRSCHRTRLQSDPLRIHDLLVLLTICGMALWAVVIATVGESPHFDPYAATTNLFPPTQQVIQILAVATPALVYLRHRRRTLG